MPKKKQGWTLPEPKLDDPNFVTEPADIRKIVNAAASACLKRPKGSKGKKRRQR